MLARREMREIMMRERKMRRAVETRMAAGWAAMTHRSVTLRLREAWRSECKHAAGKQNCRTGEAFRCHGPPAEVSRDNTAHPI
jgi:hypothetical protein